MCSKKTSPTDDRASRRACKSQAGLALRLMSFCVRQLAAPGVTMLEQRLGKLNQPSTLDHRGGPHGIAVGGMPFSFAVSLLQSIE